MRIIAVVLAAIGCTSPAPDYPNCPDTPPPASCPGMFPCGAGGLFCDETTQFCDLTAAPRCVIASLSSGEACLSNGDVSRVIASTQECDDSGGGPSGPFTDPVCSRAQGGIEVYCNGP